jgi:xanthosine phosphorylase
MTMPSPHDAAAAIRRRAPEFAPRVGLVLGSGLGRIADAIDPVSVVPYRDIPGFPQPGVEGHAGRLLLGSLSGTPVACLQGRVHVYEGADAASTRLVVRSLKLLGCSILVLTNAAGSLRPEMGAGSLMLLSDHINMQPFNPLVGANDPEFGPRFPGMEDAYDPALRALMRESAEAGGVALHEGVYVACLGPSFETPAENRAFARLGGDAVGMSTVPEAIVARHCGMRVAAVSVITNFAAGLGAEKLSHEQTLREAELAAERLGALFAVFFERLARA